MDLIIFNSIIEASCVQLRGYAEWPNENRVWLMF